MSKNSWKMLLPAGFESWPELEQDYYLTRAKWLAEARPNQLPPEGDWRIWFLCAGRGFGKTRTAGEHVAALALSHPGCRVGVVAPTFADVRDTCFEGPAGLVNPNDPILPAKYWSSDHGAGVYNRSMGEIHLTNGSIIKGFSGDEPNRLRGPQFHVAWIDELAAMEKADEVLSNLEMATRLKPDPRILITTTPRPTKTIRALKAAAMSGKRVIITYGNTLDNRANLAESAVQALLERYGGTRRGRQELNAEILEDTPGALWSLEILDKTREPKAREHILLQNMKRIVVAVDPMVSAVPDEDGKGGAARPGSETGIIVAGLGTNGHTYVFADASCTLSPDGWGRVALGMRDHYQADRVIGEQNNGGILVEHVLRTIDPNVAYRAVSASRGKLTRAEPVAALYEQGKVHHVGQFEKLEDQMVTYTGDPGAKSPDRLDALVWAVTELMLGSRAVPMVGPVSVEGANYWG